MAKFIIIYKGAATDMADMSEEESKAVMGRWEQWMSGLGDALVDVGAPMIPDGAELVDDGSNAEGVALSGYSIIEASNMEEAKQLSKEHPFLSDGNGKFSILIHELAPVPF